jgi:hypothetical protein
MAPPAVTAPIAIGFVVITAVPMAAPVAPAVVDISEKSILPHPASNVKTIIAVNIRIMFSETWLFF